MRGVEKGVLLGLGLALGAVAAGCTRIEPFDAKKRKVLVLMFSTSQILGYAKLSSFINHLYAKRHGYDFEHVIDDNRVGRPVWQKVFLTKERLPAYDAVFWIDSDAIFNTQDTPLDEWLDSPYDFIISSDFPNGPSIANTGTFLVKNTPFGRDLMDRWAAMVDEGTYNLKFPFEQGALEDLLRRLGKDSAHTKILPAEELNSIFADVSRGHFKTFVMHLMALPADYRKRVFTAWLKLNNIDASTAGEELQSLTAKNVSL